MAVRKINESTLTAIGNAIRSKTGGSALINPEDMASEIESIETGGGMSLGLEITDTDANGNITKATWHGDVPNYAMNHFLRDSSIFATVSVDNCEFVGKSGLAFSSAIVDGSSLKSIKYVDDYAFSASLINGNSGANTMLDLSEFTGYKSASRNSIPADLFRGANAYGYRVFYMPKVQVLPYRWWYQSATPNIEVQLGSIGYPLTITSGGDRPFGATTGSGTITIYTTGERLDTIKTAVQNQAGANYTFIYKAAEATTYNGTSYAAGDTFATS